MHRQERCNGLLQTYPLDIDAMAVHLNDLRDAIDRVDELRFGPHPRASRYHRRLRCPM